MPDFRRKPLSRRIALSALCAALLASEGWAVGLGEVTLLSPLGKPLQAQIPLTHLGDLSSDQIKVTLGSDDEYSRLGVDRDYLHTQIRMQPVVEGGRAYVRVSTTQPIVEPYINFVVSLRWPTGQLAREYTMLLDIPEMAAPAAAATAAAPAVVAAARPSAAPAPTTRSYAVATPAPEMPMDGRYRTTRGDSLWGLAQRLRPAGVSVEQMMAALFAANPDAFLGGDPSRLKEAVELNVPDAAQATAAGPLPDKERGETSAAAPVAPVAQPDADRFAGTQATPSDEAPADGGARLELLAPTDIEQLSAENAALREEVRSLTSNIGALTGQLDRSEQRLQQLESQLQQVLAGYDRQRGVDGAVGTGGSPFADGSAQAAAVAPDESGGVAAAQPAPERDGSLWMHISYWIALGAVAGWALYQHSRGRRRDEAADEELEPVMASAAPRTETRTVPPLATRDQPRADLAREVVREGARVVPRETAADTAATKQLESAESTQQQWGSAQDNERYWHHHSDDTADLPLDLLDAEPVTAPAARRSNPATSGVEESVDASISAGVFLAFGRYSEAEQVLQEALQRDPSRHDLKLQLLDVYQQADMREAFDQLAKSIENECVDQPEIVAEVAALRDSYSGRF